MMIFHMLNVVGQPEKTAVDVIESAAIELVAQLFAADAESVSALVLAQHELRSAHSHRLRRHDFVGQGIR